MIFVTLLSLLSLSAAPLPLQGLNADNATVVGNLTAASSVPSNQGTPITINNLDNRVKNDVDNTAIGINDNHVSASGNQQNTASSQVNSAEHQMVVGSQVDSHSVTVDNSMEITKNDSKAVSLDMSNHTTQSLANSYASTVVNRQGDTYVIRNEVKETPAGPQVVQYLVSPTNASPEAASRPIVSEKTNHYNHPNLQGSLVYDLLIQSKKTSDLAFAIALEMTGSQS